MAFVLALAAPPFGRGDKRKLGDAQPAEETANQAAQELAAVAAVPGEIPRQAIEPETVHVRLLLDDPRDAHRAIFSRALSTRRTPATVVLPGIRPGNVPIA